jgi:hypothetical protein
MGINIGSNNVFQGNINMGDNAKQIAKNFNQEFNEIGKILELLKLDIVEKYNDDDKEVVLKNYQEFREEIVKPEDQRDNNFIKNKLASLNKAFSFIANTSSIAGLIVSIMQAYK